MRQWEGIHRKLLLAHIFSEVSEFPSFILAVHKQQGRFPQILVTVN